MQQRIVTNLWFDTEAEEAAEFYCSIFPNSRVVAKSHYNDAAPGKTGHVMTVDWELDGQRFTGINGGPQFKFNEAVSMLINCEDQDEIDYYSERLTADGGEQGPCGWVKDRYGLSWQVVPKGIDELVGGDSEKSQRAMKAMLGMRKLDIDELRRAAEGAPA